MPKWFIKGCIKGCISGCIRNARTPPPSLRPVGAGERPLPFAIGTARVVSSRQLTSNANTTTATATISTWNTYISWLRLICQNRIQIPNSRSEFQIPNSRCDLVSTRFESGHGPFSNFQNTVYLIYTAYTIYLICTAYTIYTAYTVYLILVISYIRHIQSPVVY